MSDCVVDWEALRREVPDAAVAEALLTGRTQEGVEPLAHATLVQLDRFYERRQERAVQAAAAAAEAAEVPWDELDDCGVGVRQLLAALEATARTRRDGDQLLACAVVARLALVYGGSSSSASSFGGGGGGGNRAFHPLAFTAALLALRRRSVAVRPRSSGSGDGDDDEGDAGSDGEGAAGERLAEPGAVLRALRPVVALVQHVSLAGCPECAVQAAETFGTLTQLPHSSSSSSSSTATGAPARKRARAGGAAGFEAWLDVMATAYEGLGALARRWEQRAETLRAAGTREEQQQEEMTDGGAGRRAWEVAATNDVLRAVLRAVLPSLLTTYAGTMHVPVPRALVAASGDAAAFVRDLVGDCAASPADTAPADLGAALEARQRASLQRQRDQRRLRRRRQQQQQQHHNNSQDDSDNDDDDDDDDGNDDGRGNDDGQDGRAAHRESETRVLSLRECGETAVQHAAVRAAQMRKAEYRALVAHALLVVLQGFTGPARARFALFVAQLSRSAAPAHRLFACELMPRLLLDAPAALAPAAVALLVTALIQRSGDRVVSVRAKAIASVAALFELAASAQTGTSASTAAPSSTDATSAVVEAVRRRVLPALQAQHERTSSHDSENDDDENDEDNENGIMGLRRRGTSSRGDDDDIVQLLCRRAGDARSAVVRKAALQAMTALLVLAEAALGHGDAHARRQLAAVALVVEKLLQAHCADPSLLVRRQCLAALTAIATKESSKPRTPRDRENNKEEEEEEEEELPTALRIWTQAALAMISDTEQTAQDQALEAVRAVLFEPIARSWIDEPAGSRACAHAWRVLAHIADGELQRSLQRACALLAARRLVGAACVKAVQRHVATAPPAANAGGWTVLGELAEAFPRQLDEAVLWAAWDAVRDAPAFVAAHEQIYVRLVGAVAVALAVGAPTAQRDAHRARFLADVRVKLHAFAHPPAVIQAFVRAVTRVGDRDSELDEWKALLRLCEGAVRAYVSDPVAYHQQQQQQGQQHEQEGQEHEQQQQQQGEDDSIAWRLFTIGEVALAAPRAVGARLVYDVEALTAPWLALTTAEGTESEHAEGEQQQQQQRVATPAVVRAHAFVALGKLCLEDEKLAKRCILLFVRELQRRATPPVVRNNVLMALSDLCVRYTGLVDSYVPAMALCLVDANALIRRQALFLFTRLLQESFLKMKGPLFFYLLRLGADADAALAAEARQCLLSLVRGRESLTFFMHFVEAVFHLNNYTAHAQYNHLLAYHPGVDPALYAAVARALAGPEHQPARMQLYAFLLAPMTPEHKLQLAFRLAQDVLAAVAEGDLPLPAAEPLVRDTLAVLSSRDIKIGDSSSSSNSSSSSAGVADSALTAAAAAEEEELAAGMDADAASAAAGSAAVAAAKGAVLTAIARRNVVENIVPIAVELKRFLERARSPLQRDLTRFFKVLVQDYKKEMQDIFTANKQLAAEIEYDLRQLATTTEVPAPAPSTASSTASGAPSTPRARLTPRLSRAQTPRSVVQLQSPAPTSALRARTSLAAAAGDATFSVPRMRKARHSRTPAAAEVGGDERPRNTFRERLEEHRREDDVLLW